MHNSIWILLVSTLFVAFLHALAPDHWMPFAAIARAQRWSKTKLLLITLISGIGHVGISIVFSIIGILLGFSLSKLKGIEGQRGGVVLWLLIGFGIAYMIWGIKKAREKKCKVIDEEKLKAETVTTDNDIININTNTNSNFPFKPLISFLDFIFTYHFLISFFDPYVLFPICFITPRPSIAEPTK